MTGPAFFSGGMNIAKNYDWVQGFILRDTTTAPIDLTGSLLRMHIRAHDTDHEALVSIASDEPSAEDGGIDITEPTAGKFTVIITRAQMKLLFTGEYVADLVRLRPDGHQERLWDAFPVTVVEGVTKP